MFIHLRGATNDEDKMPFQLCVNELMCVGKPFVFRSQCPVSFPVCEVTRTNCLKDTIFLPVLIFHLKFFLRGTCDFSKMHSLELSLNLVSDRLQNKSFKRKIEKKIVSSFDWMWFAFQWHQEVRWTVHHDKNRKNERCSTHFLLLYEKIFVALNPSV